MSTTIHTQWRPKRFDGVIGHDSVIRSIKSVLAKRSCRAFLFTGPYGVGKTTLARIIAREVGCHDKSLLEVDAATNNGIDAMRAITDTLAFKPLFGEQRVIILDEAHRLSPAAWTSLLKSVEEPPEHVWWVFCTTEAGKVPGNIRSRCVVYDLKPVDPDAIHELLRTVMKRSGIATTDDVLYFVATHVKGSPRTALTCLAQLDGVKKTKTAAAILAKVEADEEGPAIKLARDLLAGRLDWGRCMRTIAGVDNANAEGVRIVVLAYLTKVAQGQKTSSRAGMLLELMDNFSDACDPNTGVASLMLMIGRCIFKS